MDDKQFEHAIDKFLAFAVGAIAATAYWLWFIAHWR